MGFHRKHRFRTQTKALLFSGGLLSLMMMSVGVMSYSLPAIVIGSELNANGSVEYLFLGSGCASLPDFHWAD